MTDLGTPEERAELIAICEASSVPESAWSDRDSYGAQFQVGQCWALLRAGCDFRIHAAEDDPSPDADTIWVTTYGEGFQRFEHGNDVDKEKELHYLPTRARLAAVAGKDWYT